MGKELVLKEFLIYFSYFKFYKCDLFKLYENIFVILLLYWWLDQYINNNNEVR